jgi:hypothetical protein
MYPPKHDYSDTLFLNYYVTAIAVLIGRERKEYARGPREETILHPRTPFGLLSQSPSGISPRFRDWCRGRRLDVPDIEGDKLGGLHSYETHSH